MFMRHLINYRPFFEEDKGAGSGTGTDQDKKGAGTDDKKSYTQAELDALFTDRAKRAEDAERKKLLETLGVKDADEAKTLLEAARKADADKLDELGKAKKAADEAAAKVDQANREKDEALAKSQRRLMVSAIQLEAAKQGFDDGEITSVQVAILNDKALLELIKAKDDDTFEGVDKVVKKVAELHPRWLKTTKQAVGTPARKDGKQSGDSNKSEAKPTRVSF